MAQPCASGSRRTVGSIQNNIQQQSNFIRRSVVQGSTLIQARFPSRYPRALSFSCALARFHTSRSARRHVHTYIWISICDEGACLTCRRDPRPDIRQNGDSVLIRHCALHIGLHTVNDVIGLGSLLAVILVSLSSASPYNKACFKY